MATAEVGDALVAHSAAGKQRAINKPTNDALAMKMEAFRFEKEPLQRVLDAFAREAKVLVWVNWMELQAESITPETPVTVNLAGVPGRVLSTILGCRSARRRRWDLWSMTIGWWCRRTTMCISGEVSGRAGLQPHAADGGFGTQWQRGGRGGCVGGRHVEIGDTPGFMAGQRGVDWVGAGDQRTVDRESGQLDYQEEVALRFVDAISQGPGVPTRMYDVRDLVEANGNQREGKLGELIQAIKTTCGRDTWRDQGGRTSSLAAFDGRLYITTNPAVHEQIAHLLKLMRSPDGNVPASPRAGVLPPAVEPPLNNKARDQ